MAHPATSFSFLAASDNHFDARSPRFSECVRVHQTFADLAHELRVDLATSSGDMYERASTPEEREAVADTLVAVANRCPTIAVKGNHDAHRDCALMGRLRATHPIRVVETVETIDVGPARVLCLGWVNPSHLASLSASAGVPLTGDELGGAARNVVRDIIAAKGGELATHPGPRLFIAHAMLNGAVMSNDQPVEGVAYSHSLSDVALSQAQVALLGHIHKPQEWSHAGMDIRYIGSPYHCDYGEPEEKSFVYGRFERTPGGLWTLAEIRRIPTGARRMIDIKADWRGTGWGTPPVVADPKNADIRLTFSFDPETTAAACVEADLLKARWIDAGATEVKLVRAKRSRSVARAPEVTSARTLPEKVSLAWTARKVELSEERRSRLLELVSEAQQAVASTASARTGGVHWKRARARGLHPFPEEVTIDWDAIPGELVAVRGNVGSGKSTLLSLLPGALSLRVPRYGLLKTLVADTAMKAEVEIDVAVDAGTFRITHTFGRDGAPTCVVTGCEDKPSDTGPTAFKVWAEKHLPSVDALYTTFFWAQKTDGFAGMKPADRKAAILAVAGCDYLESIADVARKRADAAAKTLVAVTARLEEARGAGVSVDDARVAVEEAAQAVASAERAVADAEGALVSAKEDMAEIEAAAQTAARRSELRRRVDERRAALVAIEGDLRADAEILAQAEEIDGASARAKIARATLDAAHADVMRLRAAHAAAERSRADAELAVSRAVEDADREDTAAKALEQQTRERLANVQANEERLRTKLADLIETLRRADEAQPEAARLRAEVREVFDAVKSTSKFQDFETRVAEAAARVLHAESQISTLSRLAEDLREKIARAPSDADVEAAQKRLFDACTIADAGLGSRVDALRGGLTTIAEGAVDPCGIATGVLASDDATAEAVSGARAALDSLGTALRDAREGRDRARGFVADLRRTEHDTAQWTSALEQARRIHALAELHLARGAEIVATVRLADSAPGLRAEIESVQRALDAEQRAYEIAERDTATGQAHRARAAELRLDAETLLASTLSDAIAHEADVLAALEDSQVKLADAQRVVDDVRPEETEQRARRLAEARGRSSSLRARAEDLHTTIAATYAELDALPPDRDDMGLADHAYQRVELRSRALEEATAGARARSSAWWMATATLEAATKAEERTRALEAEVVTSQQAAEDWALVAQTLGKNWLQAMEVDAAGPEIATVATELLHDGYGPLWSVEKIETSPVTKKNSTTDGCEVLVYDGSRGITRAVETLSPGQTTAVGTALSIALAIVAKRNGTGSSTPTLCLDEVTASLNEAEGESWIRMVRSAARRLGASKVLFVVHQDRLAELADSVVTVANGALAVTSTH